MNTFLGGSASAFRQIGLVHLGIPGSFFWLLVIVTIVMGTWRTAPNCLPACTVSLRWVERVSITAYTVGFWGVTPDRAPRMMYLPKRMPPCCAMHDEKNP